MDGDGLRACEQCGNDATGRLCRSCAEQKQIDQEAWLDGEGGEVIRLSRLAVLELEIADAEEATRDCAAYLAWLEGADIEPPERYYRLKRDYTADEAEYQAEWDRLLAERARLLAAGAGAAGAGAGGAS